MRGIPPLNAVQTFEAAARHLSFQRAADELHVTPSAVSHQVRSLEQFLGIRLFRRLARRVILTPEGQAYLPAIRAALDQIQAATARITVSGNVGPLTMSVAPTFATGWLVPRLPHFQVAHPNIEVRISLDRSTKHLDLVHSDVDLAIHYGEIKQPGLQNHRLISEELVPVCSPALLQGTHALRQPDDLKHATLLHALPRLGQWHMWLRAAGITGVDAERGPKFHNTPLTLQAAAAGMGVALTDRLLVAKELEGGRLVIPFEIARPGKSAYYLVYPNDRADNSKLAAFREWLLTEVGKVREGADTIVNE